MSLNQWLGEEEIVGTVFKTVKPFVLQFALHEKCYINKDGLFD